MSQPKVSVLIPVYNTEQYLRGCLDSVISQALTDLEIICVNDGSTDHSGDILQEYAGRDRRIQIIEKQNNEGLLLARKTAVNRATGQYTVFLDSDDDLASPESIQTMVAHIEVENTDILQFSVETIDGIPTRKHGQENWLKVCRERLEGSFNIIKACIENRYSWNLWNKIYRTAICKQAYRQIKDIHLVTAEDIYGYFMIASHAKTFRGVITPPLYRYRQGSGATTQTGTTLSSFRHYAKEIVVTSCLKAWLKQQDRLAGYQDILDQLKQRIQNHVIRKFGELPFGDTLEGFRIYSQYHNPDLLLGQYSRWKKNKYSTLANFGLGSYKQKAALQEKLEFLAGMQLAEGRVDG